MGVRSDGGFRRGATAPASGERLRRLLLPAPLAAAALLVGVLTYQAWSTARSHQATVENTLRDYAAFAAWQYARRASDHLRLVLWQTFQRVDTTTLAPPPWSARSGHDGDCRPASECGGPLEGPGLALVDATTGAVRRSSGVWPAGSLDRVGSAVSDQLRRVPHSVLNVGLVEDSAAGDGGSPMMLAYQLLPGTRGARDAVVVLALDPLSLEAALGHAAEYAPLLPGALTGSRRNDDVLAAAIEAPGGRPLAAAGDLRRGAVRGCDTLGLALGALNAVVGVYPEAAGRLVVGGVPRSRLPLLLGLLGVTLALFGVAVHQMRRIQELATMRADFVASVSHELRTPLTQISLFADTLLSGRARSEDERRHFLVVIGREAKRLRALVESVLHFATAGRRDRVLALEEVVVAPEVEAALEAFAPIADGKGVRFASRLDQALTARLDRDAFRQLLLNLLDNAVKFGPEGQTVRVELAGAGGRARLAVTDEGPGIPAAMAESIFEPFVRTAPADSPAAPGSGIGLAVVRDIVLLHGGTVRATTAAEGGARFVVELPVVGGGGRRVAGEPAHVAGGRA